MAESIYICTLYDYYTNCMDHLNQWLFFLLNKLKVKGQIIND